MSATKRVVFSFDEKSYERLAQMKKRGRFNSLAETVRESLQISRALQEQSGQGYSEVIVRNPKTGKERIMVIPVLSDQA